MKYLETFKEALARRAGLAVPPTRILVVHNVRSISDRQYATVVGVFLLLWAVDLVA